MTTHDERGGRQGLLRLLESGGATTVAALAARTGLHANTVRTHLDRLVATGLAVRAPEVRTSRGRPRLVYSPVREHAGEEPGPARHLDETAARAGLTRLLLDGYGSTAPDVGAAALAAGEALLATLPGAPVPADDPGGPEAQVRALGSHLERLGFAPVLDEAGAGPGPAAGVAVPAGTVRLGRCPFLDLARARPDVACAVHLGLVRGVLDRVGGPVRADRLVPFAGPRRCDLHLVRAADPPGPARPRRPVRGPVKETPMTEPVQILPPAPAPGPAGPACGCGGHDEADPVLDVRAIPHVIRHATVLGAFDAIAPGASLVVVAPHRPDPLLAQLAERAPVDVELLVDGPDAWHVRVTRRAS
jgi:predicted ArsR family transcriptional regulator/uncharacterized protein (DUF2249 family)